MYDLALCYRNPLVSILARRHFLERTMDEIICNLRMLGHCTKYTKIWSLLIDNIKEVYFTFLTHLEQECPVLWTASLGLYYRRLASVPPEHASCVSVPRNPFKRYKKASCLQKNLCKSWAPVPEQEYSIVPFIDQTPDQYPWPPLPKAPLMGLINFIGSFLNPLLIN